MAAKEIHFLWINNSLSMIHIWILEIYKNNNLFQESPISRERLVYIFVRGHFIFLWIKKHLCFFFYHAEIMFSIWIYIINPNLPNQNISRTIYHCSLQKNVIAIDSFCYLFYVQQIVFEVCVRGRNFYFQLFVYHVWLSIFE